MSIGASRGSRSSAASMMDATTSTDGAFTRRWEIRGGFARSATFVRTHPHRTAWWRADEMMAWWLRMVFGDSPRVLHRAVEVVEVLRRQPGELDLAEAGPDRLLDLRPVGAHGRRREVEPLALFQPAIEKLAERVPEPVLAPLAVPARPGPGGRRRLPGRRRGRSWRSGGTCRSPGPCRCKPAAPRLPPALALRPRTRSTVAVLGIQLGTPWRQQKSRAFAPALTCTFFGGGGRI